MCYHMYFFHDIRKIKVDSYDSLPTEKILTLDNVIMLITSVLDKDKNHYYKTFFWKILISVS